MNLVYTAIYGGYDKLWQPRVVSEGWQYRCYTDSPLTGGVWKVINKPLPYDSSRNGRFIKITHCMENFDNILWIDGNVEIKRDLNEFLKELPDDNFVTSQHPCWKNVNQELSACIRLNKDSREVMTQQVDEYGKISPYQHIQSTIILRRGDCKPFTDIWWNEVKNKSKRDQLSFGWAIQQSGQRYGTVPWKLMMKYFVWHNKHPK